MSGTLAKRQRPRYRPVHQKISPCAASTSQTSVSNSETGEGLGASDQRSMLTAVQASQTISMSCTTTARRGWMPAISLRSSMPPRVRAAPRHQRLPNHHTAVAKAYTAAAAATAAPGVIEEAEGRFIQQTTGSTSKRFHVMYSATTCACENRCAPAIGRDVRGCALYQRRPRSMRERQGAGRVGDEGRTENQAARRGNPGIGDLP